MSRTAHHRVKNTLNSVSLMLAGLAKRMSDVSVGFEIRRVNEHLKNYVLIHDLLSELESTGDSTQDRIDLSCVVERWAELRHCSFGLSVGNSEVNNPVKTYLPTPFVSSVLQLLVELESIAIGAGLVLQSLYLGPADGVALTNIPGATEITLSFKGLWVGGAPTGDFFEALSSAVCESPIQIIPSDTACTLFMIRLKTA